MRLLELVSAALEATANGAQARIQLELVLIKAAAPEVDPSTDGAAGADRAARERRSAQRAPLAPPRATARPPHRRARQPAAPRRPRRRARAAAGPPAARATGPGPTPAATAARPAPPPAGPDPPPPEPSHCRAEPPLPRSRPRCGPRRGAVELDTLVASWPAVVDIVRQGNAMLAAPLEAAAPGRRSTARR